MFLVLKNAIYLRYMHSTVANMIAVLKTTLYAKRIHIVIHRQQMLPLQAVVFVFCSKGIH